MSKKIYIAGFDVFKPDAVEIGAKHVQTCKDNDLVGHYPLDNEVDFTEPKKTVAQKIFLANKKLIDDCDVVIANLNPFRGKEVDSGTAWECGYASGQGKRVIGYMDEETAYINTFHENEKNRDAIQTLDKDGLFIEDFDMPVNLMLGCSIEIVKGDFNEAVKYLKEERNND